jgi:hypothetical protein
MDFKLILWLLLCNRQRGKIKCLLFAFKKIHDSKVTFLLGDGLMIQVFC